LLLVRHGQTTWNIERRFQGWSDSSLTSTGVKQAECLARRLSGQRIKAVYTSDLGRACQTAQLLARPHGLDPVVLTDMRETCWGEWEGQTAREIEAKDPKLWQRIWRKHPNGDDMADWETTSPVPGAESHSAACSRIVAALERIHRAHCDRDDQVVLVGHGGSLRFVITTALGLSPSYARRFHLDNASLSIITYYPEEHPKIRLLNDQCHLHLD